MHSNSLDLTTKATFLLQRLNSTSSYEKGDIFELIIQVFACLEKNPSVDIYKDLFENTP